MSRTTTKAHPSVHDIGHTFVPHTLLYNRNLSHSARFLLIYLCSFAKGWTFHDHVILEDMGFGKDKLYSLFGELRKKGYLKRECLPQNEAGQFMGSQRVFSREPIFLKEPKKIEVSKNNNEVQQPNESEFRKSPNSDNSTEFRETEFGQIPNSYNNTKISNINTTSNCSNNIESDHIVTDGDGYVENKVDKLKNKDRPTKEQIEAAFNRYWDLYPNKKGKSDALKYFTSLMAPLPLNKAIKLSEEIYAGLVAYVTEGQILRKIKADNPTWRVDYPDWKHGNFWLTAKRWLDIEGYQTNYDEVYSNVAQKNAHKQSGNQPYVGTAQQYEEAFAVFERPSIPDGASPTCFV